MQEFFESVTHITVKKYEKLVSAICSTYEDFSKSCSKSKTILALQVLVFGLGFYIFVFFLPDKIEQFFSNSTDPVPHFSAGNAVGMFFTWLLDGYFPTSPSSAFKLTVKKAIFFLFTYLSILVYLGWKSTVRLFNNLLQLPTLVYGKNL